MIWAFQWDGNTWTMEKPKKIGVFWEHCSRTKHVLHGRASIWPGLLEQLRSTSQHSGRAEHQTQHIPMDLHCEGPQPALPQPACSTLTPWITEHELSLHITSPSEPRQGFAGKHCSLHWPLTLPAHSLLQCPAMLVCPCLWAGLGTDSGPAIPVLQAAQLFGHWGCSINKCTVSHWHFWWDAPCLQNAARSFQLAGKCFLVLCLEGQRQQ